MPKPSIDICIATYRRSQLLLSLYQSLCRLRKIEEYDVRLIIVDNDPQQSAQGVVDLFDNSLFKIIYDIAPIKGLANVRNKLLSHVCSEFLAFLDDDEVVLPNWLIDMFGTLLKYDADAVFGPVEGKMPFDAPVWAQNQPCFKRSTRKTGTLLSYGATNNVLMRTRALGDPFHQFDEQYNLTGGEDIDFFYRLRLTGKKFAWCDEALVQEHIPEDRLTTRWVYRRALRGGQCFSRIFISRLSIFRRILWAGYKILQLIIVIVILPIVFLFSFSYYVQMCGRICAAFGQLTGLLGQSLQFKEYEQK